MTTPDLAARLAETAAREPERPAVVWQDRVVSYRELAGRVEAGAGALQRLGVARGDRVALLLGNTPHFVEAYLAALRAGASVVPLNPSLAPPEVVHAVRDSGAVVLVAAEPTGAAAAAAAAEAPDLRDVVAAGVDAAPPWAASTWGDLLAAGDPADPVTREADDVALLVYTSGTTGRPKGAMLTRRNLAANQDQVLATRLATERDDVVLAVLPLSHIYALNVGLGTTVRVGATLVLSERFDPAGTLDLVGRHGVTVLLGAPPMYVAWLNTPGVADAGWERVRVAVSGAAPLPAAVLERFREEVGVTIWEGYGLTEAAPAVTSNAMGEVAKPGSVGLPLPGVELRLVGADGGDVETGDPGEVWVRGENVFVGYWNDRTATAETLTPDGWLRTGDVGIRDDDGYLRLVDRKKDLVIVSGFNVYPREVEEVLYAHPAVAAAAVVGAPHPYTGETVKAFVVRAATGADVTEDEVVAWCRARLARFKCPEVVEFVAELPHTPTGKVRRGELRRS